MSIYFWHDYSIWYFLGTLVTWVLVGGFGVEVGFHRYFSHGMFDCSKTTARILGLLGCLSLNGDPIFWSGVHSGSHHKHTDTIKDVHSPIHGFWHSYLGWIIDPHTYATFNVGYAGRRALGDVWFVYYQRYYLLIIASIFSAIFFLSPSFFFMSFIPGVVIAFNQGPSVNVLCHSKIGYRNYEVSDLSKNVRWLSYLTFGLALHNNHHKFPRLDNFATHDNEIDLGFKLINLTVSIDKYFIRSKA